MCSWNGPYQNFWSTKGQLINHKSLMHEILLQQPTMTSCMCACSEYKGRMISSWPWNLESLCGSIIANSITVKPPQVHYILLNSELGLFHLLSLLLWFIYQDFICVILSKSTKFNIYKNINITSTTKFLIFICPFQQIWLQGNSPDLKNPKMTPALMLTNRNCNDPLPYLMWVEEALACCRV